MSTDKLVKALCEAAQLLRDVDATFWSERLARVAARGEQLDGNDIVKILSWFGGMGSFDDVIISPINDHRVTPAQEPLVNAKLEALRRTIYAEATQLRRGSG